MPLSLPFGITMQTKLVTFVLYLTITAFSTYVLIVGKAILVPLVISIFIAFSISSLENNFLNIRWAGRRLPNWLALTLAIAVVVLVLVLLVNLVVENVGQVVERAPAYQASLVSIAQRMALLVGAERLPTLEQIFSSFDLASLITAFLSPLSAIAGNTFTIVLYVSFMLVERQTLQPKLRALIHNPQREAAIQSALENIKSRIRKYLWIKTFISFLTAGFSFLVMWFLKIDFAAFWAVLIFILNFIPYVGSMIAVAFPVLLTLVQFQSLSIFLTTLVLLTVVQLLVGSVLEPRVMGKSLNLSPLVILLTLATWWSIWGVVGMMICVPLMVIAMIIFAQFQPTRPIAIIMSQEGQIDGLTASD